MKFVNLFIIFIVCFSYSGCVKQKPQPQPAPQVVKTVEVAPKKVVKKRKKKKAVVTQNKEIDKTENKNISISNPSGITQEIIVNNTVEKSPTNNKIEQKTYNYVIE